MPQDETIRRAADELARKRYAKEEDRREYARGYLDGWRALPGPGGPAYREGHRAGRIDRTSRRAASLLR